MLCRRWLCGGKIQSQIFFTRRSSWISTVEINDAIVVETKTMTGMVDVEDTMWQWGCHHSFWIVLSKNSTVQYNGGIPVDAFPTRWFQIRVGCHHLCEPRLPHNGSQFSIHLPPQRQGWKWRHKSDQYIHPQQKYWSVPSARWVQLFGQRRNMCHVGGVSCILYHIGDANFLWQTKQAAAAAGTPMEVKK